MKPYSYHRGIGKYCEFCVHVKKTWGKPNERRVAKTLLDCKKHECRVAWNGGCHDFKDRTAVERSMGDEQCS